MRLTEENFILFAAKCYTNPSCESMEEFYDDLNRFKYIKRLFTKYQETGEIKVRLVLNHLIILYNLFGAECTRMLFLKLETKWGLLKPFLISIDFLPDRVNGVSTYPTIITSDITMDQKIVNLLRKDLIEDV